MVPTGVPYAHPYAGISVECFRSVAIFSRGLKPRLKVATDLKPETEIDAYGTNDQMCHFLFLVPVYLTKEV